MTKKALVEIWIKKNWKLIAKNNRFITLAKNIGAVLYTVDICIEEKCIEVKPTRDKEVHYFTRIENDLANLIQKTMEWLNNE